MNHRQAKTSALTLILGTSCAAQPVVVTVDLDALTPGIQDTITVPRGTKIVRGIAVYVYDPTASHSAYGLGYFGGLNRGISLGHAPLNNNIGRLTDMIPTLGTPAITGNTGYANPFGTAKGFSAPEVQYFENGAATPGALPTQPTSPQFYVDVELSGPAPGDVYPLYLLDMVAASQGAGAFSTQSPSSLDSGGDVIPDQTISYLGIDSDKPVPVPPAAFEVDYIDGPITGGGAQIIIDGCYADCDQSTGPGTLDIFDFLCFQDNFVNANPFACDCDTSTGQGVCDIFDFLCFQNAFVAGCP